MRSIRHLEGAGAVLVAVASTITACSTASVLPEPRPVVVYSGQRLQADDQRMKQVSDWLTPVLDRIDLDPDFFINLQEDSATTYPWDTLAISGDTVDLSLYRGAPDAQSPYLVYGFLELMGADGTLEDVLPEGMLPDTTDLSEYGTERAILTQVAEVWLLGRSVYDTHPFGPLDELVYAEQSGFLDDFIFATQGKRFSEAAAEYQAANPGREAEFRSWFRETFEADGPRYVRSGQQEENAASGAAADVETAGGRSGAP